MTPAQRVFSQHWEQLRHRPTLGVARRDLIVWMRTEAGAVLRYVFPCGIEILPHLSGNGFVAIAPGGPPVWYKMNGTKEILKP